MQPHFIFLPIHFLPGLFRPQTTEGRGQPGKVGTRVLGQRGDAVTQSRVSEPTCSEEDPGGTVQLRVRRLSTMRGSYMGWGPQGSLVWRAGAPGHKEGVLSGGSQARGWVPKRTGRGFCTTLRGQPGTGWGAKKDEEGILPEKRW